MQEVNLNDQEEDIDHGATEDTDEKITDSVLSKRSFRPQRTQSPRKITITGVEERGGSFSRYTAYIIQCEPPLPGVVTVARRYRWFTWLREHLCAQFPGIFVPPLPPKKNFGRFADAFVQQRQQDLQRFLNRVEAIQPFSESQALTIFLSRPETTFEQGWRELKNDEVVDTAKITYNLQNIFPDLHENVELSDGHATEDIPRLKEFLDRVKGQMRAVEIAGEKVLNNLNTAAADMQGFSDMLEELYAAEDHYPYKPDLNRVDIKEPFKQWVEFFTKQTDAYFANLFQQLSYELQDIDAFIQMLGEHSRIQADATGKSARCDKWRQKEKDGIECTEAEAKAKETDMNNEREATEYLSIVTKIILHSEITEVWNSKLYDFRDQMISFTRSQSQYTQKMLTVWQEAVPS